MNNFAAVVTVILHSMQLIAIDDSYHWVFGQCPPRQRGTTATVASERSGTAWIQAVVAD
jgi:hypothetical protein